MRVFALLMMATLWSTSGFAADAVAVRFWPLGGVSIEPYDLRIVTVGVQPSDIARMASPPVVQLQEPGAGGPVQIDDETVSAAAGPGQTKVVELDGVRTVVVGNAGVTLGLLTVNATTDARETMGRVDALLFPNADSWNENASELTKVLRPAVVVLPASASDLPSNVQVVPHNTVAIRPTPKRGRTSAPKIVALSEAAYEMSDELATLFEAKESACAASREVFRPLTVAQMNHRPADGSHTPRWNAEHMRGRELLFFSQIYNALDPTIAVRDTNPKQMPADYRAAHPDWTGAQEAEEMRRVEAFTRRYAYLLDGLDPDEKAPGSRSWTPRRLLEQMDRHYAEHTANVRKKFTADDWPAGSASRGDQ